MKRDPRTSLPWLLAVFLVVFLVACGSEQKPAVFAAASLADLMEAGLELFDPGVELHLEGSSTLRAQIDRGAVADLLITADRESVEGLGQEVALWINELVLIASKRGLKVDSLHDLESLPCVAIADPEIAPAGRYARRSLQSLGVWKKVSRNATGAPNVRSVLGQVATGACAAGIVYASDARTNDAVRIVMTLPLDDPVTYYGVVPPNAKFPDTGAAFLAFLQGPHGVRLALEQGLKPLGTGQ